MTEIFVTMERDKHDKAYLRDMENLRRQLLGIAPLPVMTEESQSDQVAQENDPCGTEPSGAL